MRPKKSIRKLVLNKKTISNLRNGESVNAKGGNTGLSNCRCLPTTSVCPNRYETECAC